VKSRVGNRVVVALLELATRFVVTRRVQRGPSSPGWFRRVGQTRLRRSDLPVGFAVAMVAAFLLKRLGRPDAAGLVTAWAVEPGLGSVGTRILEPDRPGLTVHTGPDRPGGDADVPGMAARFPDDQPSQLKGLIPCDNTAKPAPAAPPGPPEHRRPQDRCSGA
jgi:hypothetical protein